MIQRLFLKTHNILTYRNERIIKNLLIEEIISFIVFKEKRIHELKKHVW